MNWLDGIIGFISPEWGARREAWRQSLTEMRNYDAATMTGAMQTGGYSTSRLNLRTGTAVTMSEPEPETWSETPT